MKNVLSFGFIKAFDSKQGNVQNVHVVKTCRDYVTSRKITTALKIAVDSVTTLLAPFSWRQPIKFNLDVEERKLLLIAMVQ